MGSPYNKPATLALIALVGAGSIAGAARGRDTTKAHGSGKYERSIRPIEHSAAENALFRPIVTWGNAHGLTVQYDGRLARAAKRVASDMAKSATHNSLIEKTKAAARGLGLTDAELLVISLRADSVAQLPTLLRERLSPAFAGRRPNRAGVAIVEGKAHTTALVALSRRRLEILPFPRRIPTGAKLRITGVAPPEKDATAPRLTLVVGREDGRVERRTLELRDRSFDATVIGDAKAGVIDVQLLIDAGDGPQIAAAFPIGIGKPPWEAKDSYDDIDLGEHDPTRDDTAELAAMLLRLRGAENLPLPAQSGLLAEVAEQHAKDMRDHGFFAHVSPTTGSLGDRLRRQGIHYMRAVENLAQGETVEDLVRAWLESPSHRANIFDAGVSAFGVGIVPAKDSPSLIAVLVLARLGDTGSDRELADKARRRINQIRRRRGLNRLADETTLDAIAARHSQEMAGGREPTPISPIQGNIVQTVFRRVELSQAAADVYLADSVDVVERSYHAMGNFDRVGIGVYRDPTRRGAQLWVTVIYAAQ